jgi:hypothetical protein
MRRLQRRTPPGPGTCGVSGRGGYVNFQLASLSLPQLIRGSTTLHMRASANYFPLGPILPWLALLAVQVPQEAANVSRHLLRFHPKHVE